MTQQTFNPVDFGDFRWTDDNWYSWNQSAGQLEARRARDAKATILRKAGHQVRKFSLRNQVISRGGVGSGHSHVTFVVTVFGIN